MSQVRAKQIQKYICAFIPFDDGTISATGLSDDVSDAIEIALLTAGDGGEPVPFQTAIFTTRQGVATTTSLNRARLYNATSKRDYINTNGDVVYGRITEATGVYTITYYYLDKTTGTETAYNFVSSVSLTFDFVYLFDFLNLPKDIGVDPLLPLSSEPPITAGTTSQYFRGDKTFQTLDKTAVGLANVDNTSDVNKPVSTATQSALNAKEPTIAAGTTGQYYRGDKSFQTLNQTVVGLANVDNTSDVNKPVSTATQTALSLKANIASPTFTGTVGGITKTMVGLGNVDNTSDANKPISTATQTALDAKEPTIAAGTTGQYLRGDKTFTSVVVPDGSITIAKLAATGTTDNTTYLRGDNTWATVSGGGGAINTVSDTSTIDLTVTTNDLTASVINGSITSTQLSTAVNTSISSKEPTITAGTTAQYWRGDKSFQTLDKIAVGLANVDNTTDANKPVSTLQQTALDLKANLASPTFTGTVSGITKTMVALGNVDNTSDANKPVSTATQTALNLKSNIDNPTFTTGVGLSSGNLIVTDGALRVGGSTTLNATTPIGGSIPTKIDIPLFTLGAFGQLLVMGVNAASPTTARAFTVLDARTVPHQPTINVLDPTENYLLGFSWDGSNTTGLLKNTGPQIGIHTNGALVSVFTSAEVTIDVPVRFTTANKITNVLDPTNPQDVSTKAYTDLKAPIASPTFTGTVSGITSTMIGLGNVDNTSDANKPISTATQTALNLKENTITAGTVSDYYRGDKTWVALNKAAVGLGNVDNTSDANKPVSTATQTALNLKANLASPTFTGTVSGITSTMVGLANVDDTSDANKPVSTATQTALNLKENSIATAYKTKLLGGDKTFRDPITNSNLLRTPAGGRIALSEGGSGTQTIANTIMFMGMNCFANTITTNTGYISVTTGAAGNCRVYVYSSEADTYHPLNKLFESADISTAATGTISFTMAFTFTGGVTYWVGIFADNNCTVRSNTSGAALFWSTASNPVAGRAFRRVVGTYPTAAPATFSALIISDLNTTSQPPQVLFDLDAMV